MQVGINYTNLVSEFKRFPGETEAALESAFRKRDLKYTDFNFGRLYEEIFGWQQFAAVRSKKKSAHEVFEAAGEVSTVAFQKISGQIVFSAILESYTAPEFIITGMIPSVSTMFNGERIPGISGIGPEALVVPEGEPYPRAGVVENWLDTPLTKKRGLVVPVTKEAVFFDRTGVLLDRCRQVGYWLGYDKELRAIDCVIDENAGAVSALQGGHRYHWQGNSIATYGNSSGTHSWDNLSGTTTLVDYTDVEACELLFDAMTDPQTGVVTGAFRAASSQIIVTTQNVHTAKQILNATEIRVHVGGYPTSGNPSERASANTLDTYQIVTSPLLAARMATDSTWYMGNIGRAFRYMENWPIQTKEASTNSQDEFERDIVAQFRADERGAYATFEPRFMVKATVA